MNTSGISLQEDCLIGANDFIEKYVCNKELLPLVAIARQGILTEILVGVVIILFVLILYKKLKKVVPDKVY